MTNSPLLPFLPSAAQYSTILRSQSTMQISGGLLRLNCANHKTNPTATVLHSNLLRSRGFEFVSTSTAQFSTLNNTSPMSRFLASKSKPFSALLSSSRHRLASPPKPPWAAPSPSCPRFSSTAAADRDRSSRKTLVYLVGVAAAMVGASYAAVPLYRRFCQATGYGGTIQRKETVEEKIARHSRDGTTTSREIIVQFNADVADGMPWRFIPTQREVRVKPGESALAFYTAENRSSAPITGVSTYNVTPMKAAVYFNKIQCFCFEEQTLHPGEQIDMPVFFYIDPEFETDPKMDGVNNIILSYTFFKVNES